MKHYVYGLYKKQVKYTTNRIDEHLFYVGISSGSKNLYFRERNHRASKDNPHKLNTINKYDFYLRVLWETETRKEAEDREEFLIEWFRTQLTNITHSAKDTSRARKRIKKGTKRRKHTTQEKIANRDRNLTIPYEEVISLIEEWAQNPFETQQSFVDRKNIPRTKFKDWLRLYKPEYVGLQKKKLKEVLKQVEKEQQNIDTVEGVINRIIELTGMNYTRAKSAYYRKLKNNGKNTNKKGKRPPVRK